MQPFELFEQLLQRHGQSLTSPRKLIFTLFLNSPRLSPAQVIELTRSTVNRASVYRTLTLFEELRILQRIHLTSEAYVLELGEQFSGHHHNFVCSTCGQVIPFAEPPLMPDSIRRLATQHGFSIDSHEFLLRGQCNRCKQNPR